MAAEAIATGTDHLLASMEDSVFTVTLNRPEARNAMSRELLEAFSEINGEIKLSRLSEKLNMNRSGVH